MNKLQIAILDIKYMPIILLFTWVLRSVWSVIYLVACALSDYIASLPEDNSVESERKYFYIDSMSHFDDMR